MSPHRKIAIAATLAALSLLALAPTASAQKYVHAVVSQGVGTLQGQWGFDSPRDIAVNRSAVADGATDPLGDPVDGYLYVADPGRHRIQVFDADGNFQFMFGVGVQTGALVPEVCDRTETPCQAGIASGLGGGFVEPQGIAIDQSSGHIFVRERPQGSARVQELEADGTFVRAFGGGVITGGATGTGTLTNGSSTVAGVSTTSKAFLVGQTITGEGIPANTTITAVDAGTLTLSQPAGAPCAPLCVSVALSAAPGAGNVPTDEQQTISIGAGVSSGNFKLTFTAPSPQSVTNPQTTANIPFNAPASGAGSVQEALENLTNVGAGNVTVTGSGGPGGTYTVTFTGARYADTDVAQLAVAAGTPNLAGGSATVATATQGASAFETCAAAAQCQRGVSGSGLGRFGSGTLGYGGGIDLHAPSADVVVADRANSRILRFDIPANPTDPVVPVSACTGFTGFGILNVALAVDDAGIAYAPGGTNSLQRCDLNAGPSLLPSVPLSSVAGSDPQAIVRDLEVDPTSGNLLVALDRSITGQPRYSPVLELGAPGGTVGSISHVDSHVSGAVMVPPNANSWNGIGLDPDADELYLSSGLLLLRAKEGPAPTPVVAFLPHSNITGSSATVSAEIERDPTLPVNYRIEFASSTSPGDFVTVASGQIAPGSGDALVSDDLENLLPNSTYLVRLIAAKAYGNPELTVNAPNLQTAMVPPSVFATRADSIADTSARLTARIVPNGTESTFRFQYGELGSFTSIEPIPDGPVGNGHTLLFVAEQIEGLKPATAYQYRVIADSDLAGEEVGPTLTFTTKTLADPAGDRAYELVSPADKLGGTGVGEWYRGPASLAPSGFAAYTGERFAAQGSFGSMLLDGAFAFGNDWAFADRAGDEVGWVSHSPFNRPIHGQAFATFTGISTSSEDLSRLTVNTIKTLTFFPEVSGEEWLGLAIPYLFDWGGPGGSRIELWGPTDLSLVAPGFGTWVSLLISDDGSRTVAATDLAAGIAKVRGMAGPTDPTKAGFDDLVAGRSVYVADTSAEPTDTFATSPRELVNVCSGFGASRTQLPSVNGSGDMTAAACPLQKAGRSERLVSDRGAALHGSTGALPIEDIVSPDPAAAGVRNGTSEFCSASGQSCPPQLYVRQFNADGSRVTRWISRSAVTGQDATLLGTARFEGASADGDKVFFRTNSPLTADDPNGTGPTAPAGGVKTGTASNSSWDLYRYDFPDDPSADPGAGTLTRVSAGPPGGDDGDCNAPYNADNSLNTTQSLRFASEDGSRAYFTCAKPLPGVSGAPGGGITTPASGANPATETNLYLYDADLPAAQGWRFVARLPRSTSAGLDSCASTGYIPGAPIGAPPQSPQFEMINAIANCVDGTADGTFVTFFTSGRLSADDPASPATGDIYGYEADRDEISRISAPQGGSAGTYACAPDNSAALCHGGGGPDVGQNSPSSNTPLGIATHPLVPGAHVAFFQSRSALLPEDTDTNYDVYEWRDGRLHLLTPGTEDHALYKGNDRSGRNVFFASRDALTWQDFDAVGDIYTARVGGGIEEPVRPPVCAVLADACQAAPTPVPTPVGSPSSTAISGQGNFTTTKSKPRPRRCAKGKVRKGKRCVAKKALARRACAKRKGKARQRCVRNQVRRLDQVQKRQSRANSDRRSAR